MEMHLVKQAQSHAIKILARSRHRRQWLVILSTLMICSIIVFWIWIQRYLENPTYIVQLESTRIERPFPAVIVCPEVAFASHRIESFVTRLKYPSGLNKTYTKMVIRQLAAFFSPDVTFRLSDLENIESILDYNNIDIETAGFNLTESCEESITRDMENRQLPQNISFNQKTYSNSGFKDGLMLVINQSQATPYNVDISYKWLSLHSAQRYVDLPGNGTPITPGTEMFASYSTLRLQVDEEAVNLNKNLRRCRMGYESLKYFPIYHKKYCLIEREMRMTARLCGCLKVSHLRLPGVPVCRAQNLQCSRAATVPIGEKNDECPITCDAELDRVTLQTIDLDPNSFPYDSFYNDLDFKKISVVKVYVSNRNRRIFSRKLYFTKFQLFAQLGGVFNMFFGCSVLSIFELFLILWHGVQMWIIRYL